MTGYWIGLGTSIGRLPFGAATVLLTSLIFSYSVDELRRGDIYCFVFSTGIAAVVGATCYALRLWFGQLVQIEDVSKSNEALQFGIRHILIWTTIVACVAGLIKAFANSEFSVSSELIVAALILAFSFAAVAVVEIWALLGNKITAFRLTALLLAFILASAINALITGNLVYWLTISLLSQIPIFLAIFSLRMQDYRFVRPEP